MKCPFCGKMESRVLDSRAARAGAAIRRRRECSCCAGRFTTMELVETEPLTVIKRDGRREPFDGEKIVKGLLLAGRKRNIPLSTWRKLVEDLERDLRAGGAREVTADRIGAAVLDRLRRVDEVAYLRFASVFRRFSDAATFRSELERMGENEKRC